MHCKECSLSSRNHLDSLYLTPPTCVTSFMNDPFMVAINKNCKYFSLRIFACLQNVLDLLLKGLKRSKEKKRIDEKSKEDEQKPHWKQIRDFVIAVGNPCNCFCIWPSLHPRLYFLKYKFHKVVQLVSIGLFWFCFMPFL